ncbi:MAG: THUMP domain-containing protein, partial [Alcaligenaceae bacterium]|nr:THUMP domain-containing protein [Alcaligenaceae bacterium]
NRRDDGERRDRFDARGGEGRGPRPESGERRDRYERRDDSRRDTRGGDRWDNRRDDGERRDRFDARGGERRNRYDTRGGEGRGLRPEAPRSAPRLDPRPGRPTPKGSNYNPEAPEQLATAFATCPQGLEETLGQELKHLGFSEVDVGRSGVHFKTDWLGMMKANLYSRLATRILLQVAQGEVHSEDDVYQLAYRTAWEHFFGPEHTLRVDTSAIRSPMQSLHFCNLKAKDGIVDRIREQEGERPSIDTVRPDAKVHLFLYREQATLYLDTSGESLFKRGWRLDKGAAPLRENLAAGMLALAGWEPGQALLDPFCGSGTILIEAAWWAQNVPPGLHRPFQFMRLRNHQKELWHALRDEAFANIKPTLDTPLYGSDISEEAIEAVRANMERANLNPNSIKLQVKNALELEAPSEHGVIITNPPYGERLDSGQDDIWQPFSGRLKNEFDGWRVNIITSDLELPKKLRLKAQRRIPLYNGNLETRMFVFDMVRDSFRDQ